MEDLIPKILEYGALAVINVLLIFKGVAAMQGLTESVKLLSVKVNDISTSFVNHFSVIDNRIDLIERDLRDVKANIDLVLRRIEEVGARKN